MTSLAQQALAAVAAMDAACSCCGEPLDTSDCRNGYDPLVDKWVCEECMERYLD